MKKARIAFALLALGCSTGATFVPSEAMPNPFFINLNLVEQLKCEEGVSGSGARIDGDTVVTALHVIRAGHSCSIGGVPASVVYLNEKLDVAVLRSPKFAVGETRMMINCDGFKKSARYYAVGWAFGSQFVVQKLVGTAALWSSHDPRFGGESILKGNIYPGMSGGPIVNEDGEIVGIVNASSDGGISNALSRSLSETYLCRNGVE